MALLDPPRSESPAATAVVAAVVSVHAGASLREALDAIDRQVYGLRQVIVVGPDLPQLGGEGWAVVESMSDVLDSLDESISHAWFLHDDSLPRPDALGALVAEATRVDAAVAGSKVLISGQPGRLESVGLATDVFAVPMSGLDSAEVDQEQYDVLRDVAFAPGSSLLVQREMLDRVGGLDARLEPITAAIDLCQRVRLAGGRVVVVPSAEVLHDGTCSKESPYWRVEAGRLRVMLKCYGPLTLVWALPLNVVLGILEAVFGLFIGRVRFVSLLRSWLWNLWRLPDTLHRRRAVLRTQGDDELFRYQVRGSVRVGRFLQHVGERVVRLTTSDPARSLGQWVESGGETVRQPVVASVLMSLLFALFATRLLWTEGVPLVGYVLAVPESAWDTLRALAGGWNPAGLGSASPLRPGFGMLALLQLALLGNGGLAFTVVLVGATTAGVIGAARLLGPFGVRPAARYAAGVALMAGPAARALARDGMWHGLVALALVPWVLAVLMHRRSSVSAVPAGAAVAALAAGFLPLALFLPLAALVLWSIIGRGDRRRPVERAVFATVLAAPALLPWIGAVSDLGFFMEAGEDAFWSPSWWVVALFAVAAAMTISSADEPLALLAGWGALVGSGGLLLARTGTFGWGVDPGTTGLAAAGIGGSLVVGAALEHGSRAFSLEGIRRWAAITATVAALSILVGLVTLALPGRLGFPTASLIADLTFTAEAEPARALVIGPEADLPGDARSLGGGLGYRLLATPEPRLWEAWLSAPLIGDEALAEELAGLLDGRTFRFGEQLAPFGVRWVVVLEATDLATILDSQLDLEPLGISGFDAYEVETPAPRARDTSGDVWEWEGPDYTGPTGERSVRIAENGDSRWGADWQSDGWANVVTTDEGRVRFGPVGVLRAAAVVGLSWLGALLLLPVVYLAWRRRT